MSRSESKGDTLLPLVLCGDLLPMPPVTSLQSEPFKSATVAALLLSTLGTECDVSPAIFGGTRRHAIRSAASAANLSGPIAVIRPLAALDCRASINAAPHGSELRNATAGDSQRIRNRR